MQILINSIPWNIHFVNPSNPNLITNSGIYTLGMTDNNIKTIFLNNKLHGELLYDVLCHELTHAYIFSYKIPYSVEEEERLCQFISGYGKSIIQDTDSLLDIILHSRMVL